MCSETSESGKKYSKRNLRKMFCVWHLLSSHQPLWYKIQILLIFSSIQLLFYYLPSGLVFVAYYWLLSRCLRELSSLNPCIFFLLLAFLLLLLFCPIFCFTCSPLGSSIWILLFGHVNWIYLGPCTDMPWQIKLVRPHRGLLSWHLKYTEGNVIGWFFSFLISELNKA